MVSVKGLIGPTKSSLSLQLLIISPMLLSNFFKSVSSLSSISFLLMSWVLGENRFFIAKLAKPYLCMLALEISLSLWNYCIVNKLSIMICGDLRSSDFYNRGEHRMIGEFKLYFFFSISSKNLFSDFIYC